jgi:four helix bundle protein
LALSIYRKTRRFAKDERYGMTSQLRRASLSEPANIAEGASLFGRREFARHLNIAIGPLGEVSYLLRFCKDANLLDSKEFAVLKELRERASIVTWRLHRKVRSEL